MVDSESSVRPGGPAVSAGPPVVPQDVSRVGLVALTVVVLAEVLRATFPPFGQFAETAGGAVACALILLACLAGFLAPGVRAFAGRPGLLIVGVGGLLA